MEKHRRGFWALSERQRDSPGCFNCDLPALVWVYFKSLDEPVLFRVSLSMMLGGAIGNIIDRVTQGFVTDFIAVGRFPVFNVADSAVTVGVGLMLLAIYLQEKKQKSDPEEAEGNDAE